MIECALAGLLCCAPDIIGVEARADGLVITLSEQIDPLPVEVAAAWTCTTGAPTDIVCSPDGRRLFLRIDDWEAGALQLGNDQLQLVWAGIPATSDRPGPDFSACDVAVQPQLDRTPGPNALRIWTGEGLDHLAMKRGGPFAWTIDGEDLVVDRHAGDMVTPMPLGSGRYHVEWMSPPGGTPGRQDNGNSGVKLASRYELQILNTPGPPHDVLYNEAGSIYRIKAADTNASVGPGRWQSYDVWFTEPIWTDGEKIADARMTVWWNGVKVHDDVLVPAKTGSSIAEGPDQMPLLLQAHGSAAQDEVRFRNVWFEPAEP